MSSWSSAENLRRKAENFQGGGFLEGLGEVALPVYLENNILNFFEMRKKMIDEKVFSLMENHGLLLTKAMTSFIINDNLQIQNIFKGFLTNFWREDGVIFLFLFLLNLLEVILVNKII